MSIEDSINDYISTHPKACLIFLLLTLCLIWQTGVVLLASLIYFIFIRWLKLSRVWLLVIGMMIAFCTLNFFHGELSRVGFILRGFHLNKIWWQFLLQQKILLASTLFMKDEIVYVLGFSALIAALFAFIELMANHPHGKTMQALQEGIAPDEKKELSEKEICKHLDKCSEEVNGTLLGVSCYSANPIILSDRDINEVALVLGTTGAGKTVTLRRFFNRAVRKGYPLVIIDGKPEETNIDWLQKLAEHHSRPFYGFNCGNFKHYDPLAHGGFTELKDKVICLKDDWSSDYYRSIAEDYLQTTFQVLLRSASKIDLYQVIDCLNYKNLVAKVNALQNEELMLKVKRLKNYEVKDITGLQAHLDILVHSELGEYFINDASSFSLSDVIESRGIVYFALPALRFPSFSRVLGKLVINDIKAVVDRQKSKLPIFTIFDEFSVFAGEQVLNLVNMGRGKGVHAVFGTQGLGDLERVDKSFKSQVLNCVNTLICHRLNDQDSAQAVSNWIGTKDAFTVTAQLNMSQSSGALGSVRHNKEFIVHPDAIKRGLKTGEAFYVTKVGGFRWDKVRVRYG